jgi:hypothetical protein
MAFLLGVSRMTYYRWVHQRREPSIEAQGRILSVLIDLQGMVQSGAWDPVTARRLDPSERVHYIVESLGLP